MDYITPKQAAEKWGITLRQVQVLCANGKILGAERLGERMWTIPKDAPRPLDGRTKAVKQAKADNGGNIS